VCEKSQREWRCVIQALRMIGQQHQSITQLYYGERSTSAPSGDPRGLFWDGQLPLFTNLDGRKVFESCVASCRRFEPRLFFVVGLGFEQPLDHGHILERGRVARNGPLGRQFAQQSPHDLAATCLG
jgi:hypothetical protein